MAREGVAPFSYVSATSGVGGGLGDPVGERICCEGYPGGMIVSADDRGERRRGSAVAPRVTFRQVAFERADVAHGPGKRRAGFGGVPSGPEHCPQFTPPFHEFSVIQNRLPQRSHLRKPSSTSRWLGICGSLAVPVRLERTRRLSAPMRLCNAYSVFRVSDICAVLRPALSFHKCTGNVRFDLGRWQWSVFRGRLQRSADERDGRELGSPTRLPAGLLRFGPKGNAARGGERVERPA